MLGSHSFGQGSSVHLRHEDIGQEEMDRACVFKTDSKRLDSMTGLQYGVTTKPEDFANQLSHHPFVIDDKNCLRVGGKIRRNVLWLRH